MPAVVVVPMRDAAHRGPACCAGTFACKANLKTPALGLLATVVRAANRPGESSRAWYAAGWMTIESHRWAHDANSVACGFVLAGEADEVVRLAVQQ